MLYETDYAPRETTLRRTPQWQCLRPRRPAGERVTVSLRVASLVKSFDVVGKRKWSANVLTTTPSRIEPFTVQPISYDVAFGGIDRSQEIRPSTAVSIEPRRGGVPPYSDPEFVNGKPLPNTEETGRPVVNPGQLRPMAFGPMGRSWPTGRNTPAPMTRSGWTRRSRFCPRTPTSATPSGA